MSLKERLSVMVVDDMSVSRGLIIQALEDIGIKTIDFCNDGESAFRKLAVKPVHLVISDYNMPGANGLQLLAGLRQYQATQRIGFILITGTASQEIVDKGAFGILDAGKDESRLVLAGFLSWARLKLQKVSAIHVQHLGLHGLRDAAVINTTVVPVVAV